MALGKTIDTDYGVTVTNAYHRVENVALATKELITFSVRAYADVNASAISDKRYECPYDITDGNPIEQAYAYLKTLTEYSGATDIIEG